MVDLQKIEKVSQKPPATALASPNLAFNNIHNANSVILTLRVWLDRMRGEQVSLADMLCSQTFKYQLSPERGDWTAL